MASVANEHSKLVCDFHSQPCRSLHNNYMQTTATVRLPNGFTDDGHINYLCGSHCRLLCGKLKSQKCNKYSLSAESNSTSTQTQFQRQLPARTRAVVASGQFSWKHLFTAKRTRWTLLLHAATELSIRGGMNERPMAS